MADAAFEPAGFMGSQIFGLPVNREILFGNHNDIYKKRIEKRQRKLIVKVSFLKGFLKKGEEILLISTGYSPLHSIAQYLTGFFFVYLKRSLIVFTNYRILHIPTDADYNYKNSIAQMAYAGCQSISLKAGTLIVQYGTTARKKIEKFTAIAVSERRKIRSLLKKKIPLSGTKGRLSARIHLCPRCTGMLKDSSKKCNKCELQFKRKQFATILALILPGGGYFYIRQYLLGFLNAVVEVVALGVIVYFVHQMRLRLPVEPLHLALIPAYVYLKIAAVLHASHFFTEFIPLDKNVQVRKIGR